MQRCFMLCFEHSYLGYLLPRDSSRRMLFRCILGRRNLSTLIAPLAMESRTYEDAVKSLNTLQTNAQVLDQIRRTRGRLVHNNLPEMIEFTEKAGITMDDIDALSVIHVSGTKGKGSTCAFSESILRHCGYKTGFYSSPHLMEVRERIRINGTPLSKDKFAEYFFDCWDNLHNYSKAEHDEKMPAYFRFLTLMSFYVFHKEKVDVAVVEVGIGGAYDSTNIVRKPVVCGVTSLGMDHVSTLGGTQASIAWQKAGIFKEGVQAYTVPQDENAMEVVANRAVELKTPLHLIPQLDNYPGDLPDLGLDGEHQKLNASLALQLCKTWVDSRTSKNKLYDTVAVERREHVDDNGNKPYKEEPPAKRAKVQLQTASTFEISASFKEGLQHTRWGGRSEMVKRPQVSFYLDGAHTPRSIEACVNWFKTKADKEKEETDGPVARVLLFNLTGDRDPHGLLRPLLSAKFDHAIFSPNIATLDSVGNSADLTNLTVTRDSQLRWCIENQRVWMALRGAGFQAHAAGDDNQNHVIKNGHDDGPYSTIFPSVAQAMRWLLAHKEPLIEPLPDADLPLPSFITKATRVQLLVTGSLHLVGTAMKVLGGEVVGDPF